MKEIRLHGRGGQGVVKASQIVVKAVVQEKKQGQFIPFFGVERKGSPVFGYLRISQQPIRRKMQVYEPDILMILDDSLVVLPATYEGLKEGGTIIMNTVKPLEELKIPSQAGSVAVVDATGISEKILGTFAKVTGLVDKEILFQEIEASFGAANREAAQMAYDQVKSVEA